MNSQTKANLFELAAYLRRFGVDGKHTRFPGGGDEVVVVVNQGTAGACWAFLHPEAFELEYFSDGKGELDKVMQVKTVEKTDLDVNVYLPRHIGIKRSEFFFWYYEMTGQEIARGFEELAS